MKNFIKRVIQENRTYHRNELKLLKELEWAHIYHDSIRGKKWVEHLPLNIGRWAGNYTFFYLLNRILSDTQPTRILEFGLGESSKMISSFLLEKKYEAYYQVIEHSEEWKQNYIKINEVPHCLSITVCELQQKEYKGCSYTAYTDLSSVIKDHKFDFYLVDGPLGSENFSRLDVLVPLQNLDESDQFIILFDDLQRRGEKETLEEIEKLLKEKYIKYKVATFSGAKDVGIILTEKYSFLATV